jgi:aspartyl-tRNA(Asn)/glutamyl-tRNA(Gln) amidotransferase subunit B
MLRLIADKTISNNAAKSVLDALWIGGGLSVLGGTAPLDGIAAGGTSASGGVAQKNAVALIVDKLGLRQMNDSSALEKIIDDVIAANADNVAQFKSGRDKAFNALVGQIMKASKGKANPQQAGELLRKKIAP